MRTYLIEEPVILDPWVMKAQLLLFFVMWFSCGMYTNTNIDPLCYRETSANPSLELCR